VVLFGPTSIEKTAWNLERVLALETDAACRPCYERVCPIDHRCMTRLAPERATAALDEWLAGPESTARRRAENAGP
jgi:heptosyltransferase-2